MALGLTVNRGLPANRLVNKAQPGRTMYGNPLVSPDAGTVVGVPNPYGGAPAAPTTALEQAQLDSINANTEAMRSRTRMSEQDWASRPAGNQVSVPSLPPPSPSVSRASMYAPASPQTRNLSSQRTQALTDLRGMLDANTAPPTFKGTDSPELRAANDLAYGRAKERIGQERLNAIRSFQGAMDTRGLTGSTGRNFESGGVGNIIAGGLGDLSDVSLAQAQDTVNRDRAVYDMQFNAQERRRQIAMSALADLYRQLGVMY